MGETKPSRREETALATRGLLLAAARECFGERGYAGAGIEEIAARAGVTTGALYHHFGSKRGLFRAVAEAVELELMQRSTEVASKHTDPLRGLEAGMQASLDASLAGDVRQIVLLDAPNVLSASQWREIEDRTSMGLLRGAIGGMMGAGLLAPGSPELVARTLVAVIGALASSIAHAPDPPAARRDAEALLGRLLAAVRAEG